MLDVDRLIADIVDAAEDDNAVLAVRDVLERTMDRPEEVQAALPANRAEFVPLHVSDRVTVLKVIWAPGMWIQPHEHLMWAAIGIYGGREDNRFFRREGTRVAESGGKRLDTGDVALLGDDVVHAVSNPLEVCTGAIHVYGGDFFAKPRRDWDPETLEEEPGTPDRSRYFEEWNERLGL